MFTAASTSSAVSGANLCSALGGIMCNFTPILPYFQHWGGWTSTTILFRCGNLVKTKKQKNKWNTFFPNSGKDQKKRSSTRIEHFFPKFTLRCTPIQIIGWDADVDHSQTIGGDTAKLLGGKYPPIPSLFRHPCLQYAYYHYGKTFLTSYPLIRV